MKHKIWIGFGIVAALAVAILFLMLRGTVVSPVETLLPKDTIYYCGSRSPLKIRAALSTMDLQGTLQESAGLTEAESQVVSDWIAGLQGAHIGFRSFTLVPLVLDATVILEGTFDWSLTDILGADFQKRFQPEEPYRDVAFQKALIPIRNSFSLEIYITEPVQNRTFIAFSRRSLTEAVDRMLDGGPSLADNPAYREMTSLKPMRKTDIIQYVDTQAYLHMFYDWIKSIPQPQFKELADLFWKELRLADYGSSVAGGRFDQGASHSFMRIEPANPLYRQFQTKSPLVLPYVPSNSCQFSFCRLAEPAKAFQQLTETTVRLKKGISSVTGNRAMEPVEDFLGQLGLAVGGNPADAGQFLTGELGMWQAVATDPLKKPAYCFYIGINDAERVKEVIASLRLKVTESDGICTIAGSRAVAWSVQPSGLLIASDPDYLLASLSTGETSLTDTPTFRKLLKKMPRDYSSLKFTTYEQGVPLQTSAKLPPAFTGVLDLMKGFCQMSVSRAENGMLTSSSSQQFNPDPQAVRAVLKQLFSAEWSQDDSSMQTTSPLDLTVDEAYSKSIELLSDGRQIDAEELVEKAYRQYSSDVRILMAHAVINRSRWCNIDVAERSFKQLQEKAAGTYLSKIAAVQLELDRHENVDENLKELVRISNEHPDDLYLLWLTGIQCREQGKRGDVTSSFKKDVSRLGQEQYEKLLARFRVGPVMVHFTYANILTEGLNNHETALKHYYAAVSMEGGWTLEGLGNTLTRLGQYDEACAVWAQAARVRSWDDDVWSNWGWTLRQMGRYEEALEKHKEAYRLDTSSAYDIHNVGYCLEELRRYDEMIGYYRQGAQHGYADSQHALGWCYANGNGAEKNLSEAFKWYQLAARQGLDRAQFEVGYAYHNGSGIGQDFKQAAEWYQKAAEQGHLTAKENLGLLYAGGQGVAFDPARAVFLYQDILRSNPEHAHTMNSYAWLLATCNDESFRNYPEAVRLAELSVVKDEQNFNLDTLAVAYDRNGQYLKAVEAQNRLIAWRQKNNPGKEIPAGMLKRLEAFEKKAAEAGL
ncbi:MAG: SEL1-like repeat protein [Verrucomicrobia bacterium]|nr:SEL1-like repeat protein [Verrucomicrobiota bacterium]